jgi:hypothetical protein
MLFWLLFLLASASLSAPIIAASSTIAPFALADVRRSGIRFADKDMRQQENLRRVPFILDHSVIQYGRAVVERSNRQITPSGFLWTQLEPDIGRLRLMSG